jgi:hypothetical protein
VNSLAVSQAERWLLPGDPGCRETQVVVHHPYFEQAWCLNSPAHVVIIKQL